MNRSRREGVVASFEVDQTGGLGARRWSLAQVSGWDLPFRERLESIVGELVANAMEHGAPPVTVEFETLPTGEGCRVTIRDRGLGPAAGVPGAGATVGAEAERGRGLRMVEDLADEVHAGADEAGYRVAVVLRVRR
jgi:anti-sigma regulatory factor (Ser/Thr protein kinase)